MATPVTDRATIRHLKAELLRTRRIKLGTVTHTVKVTGKVMLSG